MDHRKLSCSSFRRAALIWALLAYILLSATFKRPSVYAGDISNDLKTRRARVLGMMPAEDGTSYIEADVPIAELEGYMAKLRSITEGYGTFAYEFARYGHAPQNVVEKLSAEYQKNNG